MQKIYRNQLFQELQKVELEPSLFEISEGEDRGYFTTEISVRNTALKFTILEHPSSYHHFSYSYTRNVPDFVATNYPSRIFPFRLIQGKYKFYRFKQIKKQFAKWLTLELHDHFLEHMEEDLWENQVVPELYFIGKEKEGDKTDFFDEEEKEQVVMALNQAKSEIKETVEMDEETLARINEKIEYLMDAVERLNKFDWKSILLASTIEIATEITTGFGGGMAVYEIIRKAFRGVPKLLNN